VRYRRRRSAAGRPPQGRAAAVANGSAPCESPPVRVGAGESIEPGARSRWIARLVAFAAGMTGATVLFGWTTGRPALTTLGADISMKPNAAVCFLLLGAALWRRASRSDTARDHLAFALAAIASAGGGLTLLEHLSGIDLSIDQLLFTEPPGMPGTMAPARMGPPASMSFLLLGAALAWIGNRRNAARLGIQLTAVATAFIAVFPLVGYGYGTRQLFGVARFTGIALPTAMLLEALAIAVLLIGPGGGLMSAARGSGVEGRLARRTLVYSTVVPLTLGWLIAQGLQHRLYDGVFAISSLVLALILSVTLLTWRDAVHMAGIARTRDAAEGALRESEERFRLLVEGVKDYAIFMVGQDGTITTWNVSAERLKGYRAEEIIGQHVSVFFLPDDVGAGKPQELLEIAAEKGWVEDEGWRVRKDGSRFWANVVITALRDDAGRLRGFGKVTRDFTERKAAERRLAYLASFPERNPSPIVEADLDGQVRYANPAALRVFPDVREKGTAHPWLAGLESLARSIREGSAATNARVVAVGDRSYYQVLHFIREEDVVRVYGLDTTEHRRAEEALERERSLLASMMQATDVMLVYLDPEFNFVWVNEAYAATCRMQPEEMIGKNHFVLYPDAENEAAFRRVRDSGEPVFYRDKAFKFPDQPHRGVTYWDWSVTPVKAAGGVVVGLVFSLRETTRYKRAELALRETEERSRAGLRRLTEASLEVMRETGREAMLQAIAAAALELTGARVTVCGHDYVNGRFLIGGTARAPGIPELPPGKEVLVEKGGIYMDLLEGADSIRLTDEQMRAHPRWWGLPEGHVPMRGLLGARLVDLHGGTSGMILVTDKEHGEFTAEDESLLRQLATMASLALQHVDARLTLEESDRSKSQFIAMLSHELRNPLAPIRNSLHILDRAAPGGEQARRAHTVIDRQVGHLTRIVDDLLDVTRISRGKMELRRERLDLCDVVRRAIEDNRWLFERSGIECQASVPEIPVWIDGDRTRITQVLGNLLHNAAKFTEAGGKATISVEGNESARQAIIRVRDTGVGVAPEMLPRVFEPFAQADTTLDRSKGGLGLGLALVKGVVEMHGGSVSVECEGLGRGAEFTVRLPESEALPAGASARREVASGSLRVLVIEDNADAAESLRELLELGRHTVEVAFSGTEGIEKARVFRPDVVLCDIGLPGMDGYEVARTMRADPVLRGAKLVALTGYAAPEDVARSRDAGFDRHVAKPPSVVKIEEALASRADGAQGARASGVPH
jgi:PAS domain S-box-containing protein